MDLDLFLYIMTGFSRRNCEKRKKTKEFFHYFKAFDIIKGSCQFFLTYNTEENEKLDKPILPFENAKKDGCLKTSTLSPLLILLVIKK